MRIILIRHGRPDISKSDIVSGEEFGAWIERYNFAPLDAKSFPSEELLQITSGSLKAVCSTLSRSIESAKILGIDTFEFSYDFREAELPYFNVLSLKMRASIWLVFFRVLWRFGYSGGKESVSNIKVRANECAIRLSQMASKHETVVFVGHGILNRLISKNLVASGWLSSSNSIRGYWAYSVYTNKKNSDR